MHWYYYLAIGIIGIFSLYLFYYRNHKNLGPTFEEINARNYFFYEMSHNNQIHEKNEMINLRKIPNHPFIIRNNSNIKGNPFFVREETYHRLLEASKRLPPGYKIKLVDGYRSINTQAKLWNKTQKELLQQKPSLKHASKRDFYKETEKWVAPPKRHIAPHSTGTALDMTIVNSKGKELNMGVPMGDMTKKAYTNSQNISLQAKENRQILINAMQSAGFINYDKEWWHWSYGDEIWSNVTKQPQIYPSVSNYPSSNKV